MLFLFPLYAFIHVNIAEAQCRINVYESFSSNAQFISARGLKFYDKKHFRPIDHYIMINKQTITELEA